MQVIMRRSQVKSVLDTGARSFSVLKSFRILIVLMMPVCTACSSSEELKVERRFGFYSDWTRSGTDVWMGQSAAGIRISGRTDVVVSAVLPKCAGEDAIAVWLGEDDDQVEPFGTFTLNGEWTTIMRLELSGTRALLFKTETSGCRNEGDKRLLYAAIDVRSVKST